MWNRFPVLLPALAVTISVGFLILALRGVDWNELRTGLAEAHWLPWLPLGIASYLLGQGLRGLRCRLLVSPEAQISLWTATNVVVLGYAVNNLLPARLGEFARAGMLSDRTGLPYSQSLTVTFVERAFDLGAILLLLWGVAALVPFHDWANGLLLTSSFALGVCVLGMVVVTYAPHTLNRFASRWTLGLGDRTHDALLKLATHVANGVAYVRRPRQALEVGLLSLAVWICEAGLFFFLLAVFGLALEPSTALLAMGVTNLGIFLPSTPGFVGTFHFFCGLALASVGIAATTAASYAVLVHLSFYFPVTLWGIGVMAGYNFALGRARAFAEAAGAPADWVGSEVHGRRVATLTRARDERLPTPFFEALVAGLIPLETLPPSDHAEVTRSVARFTNGQIAELPVYLRKAFELGMFGFRAVVVLRYGRAFENLPAEPRGRVLRWWAYGPIALTRMLFTAVRSTALLAFYEEPAALAALDAAPVAAPVTAPRVVNGAAGGQ